MPRYAYQKPVNRLYSYNLGYMHNYYKPLTTYIEKNKEVIESGKRAPSEQPGHQSLAEITIDEDDIRRVPLWMKHPYRLPEEDIKVPPHESSIWPESVPHFNLVSSYDTMIGYLGLKQPRMFR